jgi:sugar phosphate isomerase/epimerase
MTTRRSFLQQAALLGAGLAIGPSRLFSRSRAGFREIGLQLYTLRNELEKDVKKTIAAVADAGYTQVETYYTISGPGSGRQFWGLDPRGLKALLKEHRLSTPSGHYGLNDFLTPQNGKDNDLKAQIDIAAAVGQQYFVVPVPPLYLWDKQPPTADDYHFISAQLNKAGELCKKSGLQLAYHNHFWEFRKPSGSNVTAYDIMLKETDPSLVKYEVDLFWTVKSGIDPVQLFKKAPGRFTMLHVKDIDKSSPGIISDTSHLKSEDLIGQIKFTEVGKGSINFKEILAQAPAAGVKYLFVEQDVINIDPIESIRESSAYVRKNLLQKS